MYSIYREGITNCYIAGRTNCYESFSFVRITGAYVLNIAEGLVHFVQCFKLVRSPSLSCVLYLIAFRVP